MPYRRLPNTDQARIRTLSAVIDAIRNNDLYVPVIPPELYNRAERKLKQFKEAADQYNACLAEQNGFSKSATYRTRLKNARMYVSHFLTVFNLAVRRGEIKAKERSLYSLPENSAELPDLSSDAAIIRCCQNAIVGERARTQKGGIPMMNPTVAKVNVHYDLFRELYEKQQELRARTEENLVAVAALRPEIDEVILEVWNTVEAHFANLPGSARLDACRKYGVIYYYRPGEKKSR